MRKAKTENRTGIAWSLDEVRRLRKLFPLGRARELAEQTGRPLTAVRQKAYSLGLRGREYRRWSAEEIRMLKKLYPNETAQTIADKLGRSCETVEGKASTIGLRKQAARPWSRQEVALLKKLYPNSTMQEIADKLGRTAAAVLGKAHNLGICRQRNYWSKKELNLLKKLYPTRTAEEIAERLGRPVQATRKKIVLLDLRKRFRYDDCHRVVKGAREKRCRKCRKWKGESQFYKNRNSKDGLAGWCNICLGTIRKKQRSNAKSR